ncbi:MAG: diadenylate cyclase [Desulfobacterota bacterium]|nr:diadenylate cyclase [Thermodesulfobacteriota bacterium]
MNALITFLLSLTWQDVVDVLLCSYIVFRLYILFRGTAVLRVLVGILLLVIVQRCTTFVGLVLTSWAIQGITAAAALIIIVVFRNEIRSILQARNLTAILWGSPVKERRAPITTIVESLRELAHKRCGALLVFPGNNDLSDITHGGEPVDCHISRDTMISVFWPGNPLHDGAAVIQDGRISRAGVVLPVSNRGDLPSCYGTRHRAALGLAERTDALVIAVSEERGSITAAVEGHLVDITDDTHLSRMLEQHLNRTSPSHDEPLRERRRLIAAACASFVLVCITWFSFTRGTDIFMALDIPLEYINRDPLLDIVDASANSVRLHVGGSGSLVKSLSPEQVHVQIDLRNASPGLNTFSISTEQIKLPPGIFVKKIEPASVDVILDVIVQKRLPVQADWVGKLPHRLVIQECTLEPADLLIEGPQQILADTTTLYTEKIPVDTIEQSGTITVPVVLPPSLRLVSGSDRVTVHFTVQSRDTSQEY